MLIVYFSLTVLFVLQSLIFIATAFISRIVTYSLGSLGKFDEKIEVEQ